jgi:hypothetical protein
VIAMLQYDLTDTPFFRADSCGNLPTEAEMFAITAALLLVHDVGYTGLAHREIVFNEADLAGVAECIEYRLPTFVQDVGHGSRLRRRLRNFVGLRIGSNVLLPSQESSHPT